MKDIDIAIYLVHSMMPNSKLTQAKFEDMDFLLADNFGRAAKKEGVKPKGCACFKNCGLSQ